MKQRLRHFFCLMLMMAVLLPLGQAQFVNFEDTWAEFLTDNKTSNISKLVEPSKDQQENYLKFALMYANAHFCADEINNAEDFMGEIGKIGATSYGSIPGFQDRHDDLKVKIKAYHQVDSYWKTFLNFKDTNEDDLTKIEKATKVCEKGTLAKYNAMLTSIKYCEGDVGASKNAFENRVLKLAEKTTLNIKDVPGLEDEVNMYKNVFKGLKLLGPAWKEFKETEVSPGYEFDMPVMECFPIPNIKIYILQAATDVCKKGSKMLEKINKLKEKNTHPIPADVAEKIKWLEKESGNFNGDLATLNKAWAEFVPIDTLTSGIKYKGEYCHKDAQIKAYVMEGTIEACSKGLQRLADIAEIQKEFNPELDDTTLEKIENLKKKVAAYKQDVEELEVVWKEFVQQGDTLLSPPSLKKFYCDKIAQVKSWTIKGHLDACPSGQKYLDGIDKMEKRFKLKFDDELACSIQNLRVKVWDCRYYELLMQARKETHAERERFGPQSAAGMQGALNSDKLPCETTVQYSPLGNIGIKYVISTYLCQNIDLAKMGDPEYYRKIATWVDSEVLQKYCESNMRCKEKFHIYLEGHTDGHPFKGATYRNSLGIPAGTSFTHYINNTATNKTTREISKSLKSNMELGIARAWTVKQQLDFMGVPITIGAWEHPVTEKGGQYRRVEIELNITNLLLDFFEKRLKELVDKSGIGERPKPC